MLVEMKVASLTVDPFTDMPIVILKDAQGRHAVPIWIGMGEASAIATELERIHLDRPMTHDLMKTILDQCGVRVARVEIHDLRNDTFYATLFLRGADGKTLAVEARPSDAIAMALRTNAAIYVADKVIDETRKLDLVGPETVLCGAGFAEPGTDLLAGLGKSAFGKWKM